MRYLISIFCFIVLLILTIFNPIYANRSAKMAKFNVDLGDCLQYAANDKSQENVCYCEWCMCKCLAKNGDLTSCTIECKMSCTP